MGVANTKDKLYKRASIISKKILDKKTLLLAKELREKSGLKVETLLWLNTAKLEEKKLAISIFFKGKLVRNNFLEFWHKVASTHLLYGYLINSDSAELFMAEIFFTGKVGENTLQDVNLTGVEWVAYERFKDENTLYLKISPSATPESIKDFLSLPENKLGKVFASKLNMPYLKLTLKPSSKDTESTEVIIQKLRKLTKEKLISIAQSIKPQAFEDAFIFNGKVQPSPRLKDNLIAFILEHKHGKPKYSEGYIRSFSKAPMK